MTTHTPSHSAGAFDLDLPAGRLRARAWGDPDDPLVLCLHGLSGNHTAFARIAPEVAAAGRHVVALDLRGRGRSADTGPGTYGLDSHCRDVLAAADALGRVSFDLVGWSMGALVGFLVARESPARVGRLVLLDHAGRMDEAAYQAVVDGLARLDAVVRAPGAYVQAMRAAGAIDEWSELWDAYFGYELSPTDAGWSPSTSRAACSEDADLAAIERIRAARREIQAPVLLVRCTRPMKGGGLIVPDDEVAQLRAEIPQLRVFEVDRNHFGLMDDARTVAAVLEGLACAC